MKRRLFTDELELRSIGNLTLTTHRVIAYAKHGHGEASTALLLDHVQWTRLTSASHPAVTGACAVLGVAAASALLGGSFELGTLISVLFLIAGLVHASWRRPAIIIGSGSGRIRAWLDGDADRHRQARGFVDAVDHAAAREGKADLTGVARALGRDHGNHARGELSFDATHR